MTFISYAQNYEDVMLWRALKHVEKGFYIDVGAWSPDIDSVTRSFYEKNWRGINVEPNPEFHEKYGMRRSEDINLKLAVGDQDGELLINFMSNPGLSTAVDKFAKQHESAGWTSNKQKVSLATLAAICKQHVEQRQDIHFLKVDVEGYEEAVLRGNDWVTYRPWVVVVEATLPMTQVESYYEWEPILFNAGYKFAYADGLNRFYVANEHAELLDSFKYPPNVFDGFLLNAHQEAEIKAQQAETKAQQAETKAQQAKVEVHQLTAQLLAVHSSTSWRITSPLRWLIRQLRLLRQFGLKIRLKALIKKVLRKFVLFAVARPLLMRITAPLVGFFGLKELIKRLVFDGLNSKTTAQNPVTNLGLERNQAGFYLDKRAVRVFADLKNAKKGLSEK
jgi:FkbM family methyltransferase